MHTYVGAYLLFGIKGALKLTTMVCFCWLLHVDTYRSLHSLRVAFANDN